jgi:site-specific DNA-methyltransferase (adenine-specific)
MPDESIDLTVTSPPYGSLRSYDGYSFDFPEIARQLYRITKVGGVVVWVTCDQTVNGSESGESFRQALRFMDVGFRLHDTMIWKKPTFTDTGSLRVRYGNVFEYMFVLSKGKPKTFNPIRDRENRYAGARIHSNIRLKDGSMRLKSSIGKKTPRYGQRFNVWEMPTVQSNKERTGHPAQFPLQLAKDHIISWSNEGDTILDPMMGSGTTGVACVDTGRDFIGIDISEKYVELASRRIGESMRLVE